MQLSGGWAGWQAYRQLPNLTQSRQAPKFTAQIHDPESKGPHSRPLPLGSTTTFHQFIHPFCSRNRLANPATSSTQLLDSSLRSSFPILLIYIASFHLFFKPFSHTSPSHNPAHRPENVDLFLGRSARPTGRPSSSATTGNRCLSICQPYVLCLLILFKTTRIN